MVYDFNSGSITAKAAATTVRPTSETDSKECSAWVDGPCILKGDATCGVGSKVMTRDGNEKCTLKEKRTKCKIQCSESVLYFERFFCLRITMKTEGNGRRVIG